MSPKKQRPEPWSIAGMRVRAIGGPDPEDRRRWRWRAELYRDGRSSTIWTGWGTRKELDCGDSPILAAYTGGAWRDRGAVAEPAPVVLVSELLDRWVEAMEARADLSPKTIINYTGSVRRLLSVLGPLRLATVRDADVAAYRDTKLRQGYEPSSIALDIGNFGAAWTWGVRHLELPVRADPPTARVNVPEKLRRSMTSSEVARLLPHLPDDWRRIAVLVLFATGCRPGELAQLVVSQHDLDAGILRIRRGKANPREVPIASNIVEELRAWLKRRPDLEGLPVLGVTYNALRNLTQNVAIQDAIEAAGIDPLELYAFRRGAVDTLIDAGVEPKVEAALLGHSPVTALRYRRRPGPEHLREAVRRAGLGALPVEADNVLELRPKK